jgi:hypothetical protein
MTTTTTTPDLELELAARAVQAAATAQTERDDAIQAAHAAGASIRTIAAATGLSPARVGQIVKPV